MEDKGTSVNNADHYQSTKRNGRTQSFSNSNNFWQGVNTQSNKGGNHHTALPLSDADNNRVIHESHTEKENQHSRRHRTKSIGELAIQSHEYNHLECGVISNVDGTMTTAKGAKNTSMTMNNRMVSRKDVEITGEDASVSFSGFRKKFHSLTLSEKNEEEEKEKEGEIFRHSSIPKQNKQHLPDNSYTKRNIGNPVTFSEIDAEKPATSLEFQDQHTDWRLKTNECNDKGVDSNNKNNNKTNNNKNNKRRSVNRKKTQDKLHQRRSNKMEYGEFDHRSNPMLIKDNDSERASTDDGYETSRTYASDMTTSTTSSDFNNNIELHNGPPQNQYKKQAFISSQQLYNEQTTTDNNNNNSLYNQQSSTVDVDQNMHLQTRYNQSNNQQSSMLHNSNSQQSTLYNHLNNQQSINMNNPNSNFLISENSSNVKKSSPDKKASLSNLHEILNLECEDERKIQEEETRREKTKMNEEQELEEGRKKIHQKLDSMLKARVKTMNATDRAFAKRQMKFPDPLLANEPPLIIDKEPSLLIMESVEQMSKQQSSPMATHSYSRQQEQRNNNNFTSYQSQNHDYADSVPQYSSVRGDQSYERRQPQQQQQQQQQQQRIDVSFKEIYQPPATITTAEMSNKLFHLRDKESTELNKKQSMLHELKQAMFQKSRPGSPIQNESSSNQETGALRDRSQEANTDFVYSTPNNQTMYNADLENSGTVSAASTSNGLNGFPDSSFGYNTETGEIDLYNSFPLPFPKSSTKNTETTADVSRTDSDSVKDETPINKNQVIMMLNSHIKQQQKTELDANAKSELQFRRPKITSKSFALTSNDIDDEAEVFNKHHQQQQQHPNMPPEILVTQFQTPEVQRNRSFLTNEGNSNHKTGDPRYNQNNVIHRPDNADIDSSQNNFVSRVESFSSTRVEAPDSRAVSRNTSFMSEYDPQQELWNRSNKEVLRNESFSSDQPLSYGRSRSSTVTTEQNNSISRNESFTSDQPLSYGRSRSNTVTTEQNHSISRNESFTSDQPLSYGRSRSNTVITEQSSSISRNESFTSEFGGEASKEQHQQPIGYLRRIRSNTGATEPESVVISGENISRNQSFSSSSRSRSTSILDSAIRYEQTHKKEQSSNTAGYLPSNTAQDAIPQKDAYYSSTVANDHVTSHVEEERPSQPRGQIIAPDSRGLNLSQTEYYNPSENEEKVIKPSEYKVHRFNDRNRANNNGYGSDSGVEASQKSTNHRIVMAEEHTAPTRGRVQGSNNQTPVSLNDLKRRRQQERLIKSKKLSNSEPLLDRIDAPTSNSFSEQKASTVVQQQQQRPLTSSTASTARETRGSQSFDNYNNTLSRRKKKVEKSSNEIYTNTNVGKINIPDSFAHEIKQTNNNEDPNKQQQIDPSTNMEYQNNGYEEMGQDRKHKRDKQQQQQHSNSSTPRASTPKKSRRKFSLTGITSGSSTPRSDTTETTSVSSSRPSSPSLGRRIKNMFSPRTKRKQQKNASKSSSNYDDDLDDVSMETVDDDIMRRLNMNVVNPSGGAQQNGFHDAMAPSLKGSRSISGSLERLSTNDGFSTVKSESGLSMVIADDEDFGIDDSFLSHQEWLNSHQGGSTLSAPKKSTKRPSIKQAMMPGMKNSRMNNPKNKDSWKANRNIGRVTVPQVFSSPIHNTSGDNNDDQSPDLDSNGFHKTKSPAMARKSGNKASKGYHDTDVVFTSFDVAK